MLALTTNLKDEERNHPRMNGSPYEYVELLKSWMKYRYPVPVLMLLTLIHKNLLP